MKIDRNKPHSAQPTVKRSFTARLVLLFTVFCHCLLLLTTGFSQTPGQPTISRQAPTSAAQSIAPPPFPSRLSPPPSDSNAPAANLNAANQNAANHNAAIPGVAKPNPPGRIGPGLSQPPMAPVSSPKAISLVQQVLGRLAHGQSFNCEVRQRVRAAGGEALGVGTYLQVGRGTGQFSMHLSMHDGDGKYTLQQISDGRLAYTRTEIAEKVSLIRVDVGSLDEGARVLGRRDPIKPSMLVGGPCEMLDTIRRDYNLRLGTSQLNGQRLLVIIGTLKPLVREKMKRLGGAMDRFPTHVNLMIAAENDPKTQFGKGLPIRIEYRGDSIAKLPEPSDAVAAKSSQTAAAAPAAVARPSTAVQGPLISLVEFYSFQPIKPPPIQRFRFENQDASVTFVNETSRYEERFDIRVSAKERARYR